MPAVVEQGQATVVRDPARVLVQVPVRAVAESLATAPVRSVVDRAPKAAALPMVACPDLLDADCRLDNLVERLERHTAGPGQAMLKARSFLRNNRRFG